MGGRFCGGAADVIARPDYSSTAKLVVLLAIFDQDPELRAELIKPVVKYWSQESTAKLGRDTDHPLVFAAMALHDPAAAVAWNREYHPKIPTDRRSYIPQARVVMADIFSASPAELHSVVTRYNHLWVVGSEE